MEPILKNHFLRKLHKLVEGGLQKYRKIVVVEVVVV
jgi:hypothetical protein